MASHGTQTIALTDSSDTVKKCQLANDIGVGDCVQVAGSWVGVQTSLLDENLATAVWHATTYSAHTQTFFNDTWHQEFHFLTADGQIAATVGRWDGSEMSNDNQRYSFQRVGNININSALWGQVTQVAWIYEC